MNALEQVIQDYTRLATMDKNIPAYKVVTQAAAELARLQQKAERGDKIEQAARKVCNSDIGIDEAYDILAAALDTHIA